MEREFERGNKNMLNDFLTKAAADPRLSIAHIGLFTVLFNLWSRHNMDGPLKAYSSDIMPLAKVSVATYHRLIKQLNEYGYLRYCPSFYKRHKSLIDFE